MAKAKIYAVRRGRVTGKFKTWDECKASVMGFPGAEYKSFGTELEADEYLNKSSITIISGSDTTTVDSTYDPDNMPDVYAFVDGSFNPVTKVYGYGGFLYVRGEKYPLQGSGDDASLSESRNVAGEVMGSMAAIDKAISLGISNLIIYYDYQGIEMWATGSWKTNKPCSIQYKSFIDSVTDKINLTFIHVKGHSGIDGNEEADRMAKEAVGI